MIGKILRHRYKILNKLADGGFGETYLAEDLDIPANPKPKCVVKRLQPQIINPELVRLFEKEGEILYQLGQDHSQIPQLFAYFRENQEFYLIQEFIDGHDLGEEIAAKKLWSETQVKKFVQETLEILEYVHQNNVIHRDIKPENIMRKKRNGKLILIDFGAVKQIGISVANQNQTSRTVAIGTPGYMPSEQAQGKPKFSSDIYALGMTAIHLLTGVEPQLLPEDSKGEIIWRNITHVSDDFAEFLTRMVRYDYRDRYVNATEAMQALNGNKVTTAHTLQLPAIINPIFNKLNTFKNSVIGLGLIGFTTIGITQFLPLLLQPKAKISLVSSNATPSTTVISEKSMSAKPSIIPQPKVTIPLVSPKPKPDITIIAAKPTPVTTPIISQPKATIPLVSPKPEPNTPIISKQSQPRITVADVVGRYKGEGINKNDGREFTASIHIENKSSLWLNFSDGFNGSFFSKFNLSDQGEFQLAKDSTSIDINSTFSQDWQVTVNAKFIDVNIIKAKYQLIPIKDNPFSVQEGEITLKRN
ncbi:serine/threonine protein kinase [Nostoc sp. NIES-3756]|uniref:serine/threonine-protein kinase n=1 Tax=Nostoc sp. NIES-3756 TaxID=1751286 RepID=UPI00071FEC96|nr:serine/threonine-protein kinase [Nostoc sp. NIES-3756]BAT51567.1 serine/threonine protein kinase [Nostoc sp. NIES-3756]